MLTVPPRSPRHLRPREAISLAERAGLERATLTRHWPQRFLAHLERELMRQYLSPEETTRTVWDAIILGAGPAGTIAANQLVYARRKDPACRQTVVPSRESLRRLPECGGFGSAQDSRSGGPTRCAGRNRTGHSGAEVRRTLDPSESARRNGTFTVRGSTRPCSIWP